MTIAQYARHRGCDAAAVRRAVREGRIVARQGRICAGEADAQWQQTSRARIDSPGPQEAAQAQGMDDYRALRIRREAAMLERAERHNARERAELIGREDAARSAFEALRALRDAVFACPPRLAARVLTLADAGEVEAAMEQELRAAFDVALARLQRELQAQETGQAQDA